MKRASTKAGAVHLAPGRALLGDPLPRLFAWRADVSLRTDLLAERHSTGHDAVTSFEDFIDADLFLYLRAEAADSATNQPSFNWQPWSLVYLDRRIPRFLQQRESRVDAEQLLLPLGVPNVDSLKQLLGGRARQAKQLFPNHWQMHDTLEDFDASRVGSR
jgi:hypothetical protein